MTAHVLGRRLSRSAAKPQRTALVLGSLGVLLSSCSSSHPVTPAPTTTTASPTPASSTASASTGTTPSNAAPGPTVSPATAGPTVHTVQPCATRALKTTSGGSEGAVGHTYTTIDFTNISGAACTLYGYPGVALAAGTPVQQIGAAADHNPSSSTKVVTLGPGLAGHFVLQIANARWYPAAECSPVNASYLQIYPPNQTTPIYFSHTAVACTKPIHLLTVSVVQAGS